jgi:pimeloyl-ACP methyl ester carboxylesterase
MSRRLIGATLIALGAALPSAAPAGAQDAPELRPIVFVHGFLGSGQQFEAQALRFTSNGYPADHIEVFEHDSLAYPGSSAEVWSRLDQLIADLQERTGADQVNLVGHSQGTGLSTGYLNSDPARAADVAQYVNLDGTAGTSVPDGIDVLAVWAEGNDAREFPGATNVHFPDQAHTEVVNSPETFRAMYEHFVGEAPDFDQVVRERADEIEVEGRALLFPQNSGAAGATLEIHEVEPTTGARLDASPEATFALGADGTWGPFPADGDTTYEFAVIRPTGTHHVYLQPFVRSSRWVRVLTSEPGGLADSFWETSDHHQNLAILRNKEWWGDQGDGSDVLEINGRSVLNAAISPRSNRTIGIFVHDFGLDGRSELSAPVSPTGIPFLTGVDLVLPAADPPDAVTSVVATPRLGEGPEAVCVPNHASTVGRTSVQFSSYHELLNPDGSPTSGHPAPACGRPAVAPPATPVERTPDFTG